jgi:hypothetical protein
VTGDVDGGHSNCGPLSSASPFLTGFIAGLGDHQPVAELRRPDDLLAALAERSGDAVTVVRARGLSTSCVSDLSWAGGT